MPILHAERAGLLGLIELKNKRSPSQKKPDLMHTLSYTLSALAFSCWGVWRRGGALVSLMVSPSAVYRLTVTKPGDPDFGLKLKVEKTENTTTMEWVPSEYSNDFIRDCRNVSSSELEPRLFDKDGPIQVVNPVDWTSINLKGVSPLPRSPNLGFLFATTGEVVNRLKEFEVISNAVPTLEPGMPIILKCLSSVLDIHYDQSAAAVKHLLAELKLMTEQQLRRESELVIARLRRLLSGEGEAGDEPGQEVPAAAPSEPGQPEPAASDPVPVEPVPAPQEVGIKHPYLGVLGVMRKHPILVMRDMGDSLHGLLHGAGGAFAARWRDSRALRAAFFEDVGLTALNLVAKCRLCHNDIRPPNIAFRDGRFCLLDFDMAHTSVQYQENTAFSPRMVAAVRWRNPPAELMAYSVAQIAVNVFVLDSAGGSGAGEAPAAASCIWSAERDGSAVDAAFERWAVAKGAGVRGFVSAVREACAPPRPGRALAFRPPTDHRGYFARVLRDMLA